MTVANVTPPSISGTEEEGATLTVDPGTWTHDLPVITYSYQWERCDSGGGSCINIAGATSTSYTLQEADVGYTLRAKVGASESGSSPPPSGASPLGFLRYAGKKLMTHSSDYSVRVTSRLANDEGTRPDPSLLYAHPYQVNTQGWYGITYAEANANGWVLTKTTGGQMYLPQFQTYCCDIGSSGYRTAFVNNVLAKMNSYGYDGLMLDDCVTNWGYGQTGGVYSTAYPNASAARAAMLAFIQNVVPRLQSGGAVVMANCSALDGTAASNDFSTTAQWWRDVGPYLDYVMLEYWETSVQSCGSNPDPDCCRRSGTAAWYNMWENVLALMATAYGAGTLPIGLTRGTSTRRQGYNAASFLLGWDHTKGGAFIWTPGDSYVSDTDPWNSLTQEIFDLGDPTGPYTKSGNEYTRVFAGGTVKVNPVTGTWQIGSFS